ncbi:hypothetical protein Q1695_013289 [Nippostrongylus brasiliensis]|nr:hypothetical protein Q1695_013289 [Nippostrongylus brasiliensis]
MQVVLELAIAQDSDVLVIETTSEQQFACCAEHDSAAEKMDSHEQLRELQRELRQLKQAIPPLPEPQQLYDRIVQQCHDNHEYTETTTQLEQRLRHL